ncbi:helix-turn-helix domain-containing protein [Alkanindiges illinoisensis]|uniref:helix-turn-helix domain-containing protein n=1 Tax=Alkanindiges illinoisensis TaxID=197183 RepID=UPI00047CB554|nr:helix-turn-helix transcriptional regulator [Alkanindiges illinoisensis]
MRTIHDPRYSLVIAKLIQIRDEKKITQVELAKKLLKPQSYISKTELLERRLDVIELLDWLNALESNPSLFFNGLNFDAVNKP